MSPKWTFVGGLAVWFPSWLVLTAAIGAREWCFKRYG